MYKDLNTLSTSKTMDLKSDGIIRIILILGIISACATEAVLEDFQEDIAPYPELESKYSCFVYKTFILSI